jgi:hypothetical protein
MPNLALVAFAVPQLLNQSIENATNPVTLLKLLNQSPVYGGTLGFAISLTVFVLITLVLSFRLKIVHAAMGGSFFGLLSSLLLITLGIESPAAAMLFVALLILLTVISLVVHILNPFSD